ncbi:hypothetical protein TNCV_4675741 [Trichonephila clavipes]|nr:hypothetical protein TNCV_4675741 [Trichonephila clavipes]
MREKGGNHLVPGPDCMVDALKLLNQAPQSFWLVTTDVTDENHLLRDQDCMADVVGAPNQELQYDFCVAVAECDLALA